MKHRSSRLHLQKPGSGGFSLVEVALALLVVAIGLTAIFGLFPAGMQSSRTAIDETEVAEFADFVFASLDVIAQNWWNDLSTAGLASAANRDVVSTRVMQQPPNTNTTVRTTDPSWGSSGPLQPPVQPNVFVWQPAFGGVTGFLSTAPVTQFTYFLQIANIDGTYPPTEDIRMARLQVWPGPRRDVVANSPTPTEFPGSMVFYREYRRR